MRELDGCFQSSLEAIRDTDRDYCEPAPTYRSSQEASRDTKEPRSIGRTHSQPSRFLEHNCGPNASERVLATRYSFAACSFRREACRLTQFAISREVTNRKGMFAAPANMVCDCNHKVWNSFRLGTDSRSSPQNTKRAGDPALFNIREAVSTIWLMSRDHFSAH